MSNRLLNRDTTVVEILGRSLRVRFDNWKSCAFFELTPRPGQSEFRVSLRLLRAIKERIAPSRLSIPGQWNDYSAFYVGELISWPANTEWKLYRWDNIDYDGATWVGLEAHDSTDSGDADIIIKPPGFEKHAPAADWKWRPEVLGFKPWRSKERPHVWPTYKLCGSASGELILFIMGGLSHGRFKLAKKQFDDFQALARYAPLRLGFKDADQGIETTVLIERMRLPALINAEATEPYYLIDVGKATRFTDQLCLQI